MSNKKVSVLTAFKTIIWPRRNLVFMGLILIVISRAASFVTPVASKYLIDVVIANKDVQMLKLLVTGVILAILVQAVTSFLLTKILSVQAQYMISELRAQVQKKVLSLPIRFFDNAKSGALVSRIMSDVEGVRNLMGTGIGAVGWRDHYGHSVLDTVAWNQSQHDLFHLHPFGSFRNYRTKSL